ncbi:nitrilase-related carbon-nitrogen hydrolase [Paenalcaligenes sp. Me52]|uniref:nitrilase-related carbon-nitrogen hydrolase n=1 Tax=Paenalcaligenes sp. Me52 TaxID=3392038 RepID=UPI003D2A58B2
MRKLKVGAAQIECVPGDIAQNLALHVDMIEQAKQQHVHLLVFPELSLTDYLSEPDVSRLARSVDANEVQVLCAATRGTAVSFGLIEQADDGRVYNSQVLLVNGRIQHVHRKLNLPTYGNLKEGYFYVKGAEFTLTSLCDDWQLATLICADSWSPGLPWLAALKGANLLVQPIASARGAVGGDFDNPGGWDLNLRYTCMTYGVAAVMANHCGRRDNLDFWGGSCILDANAKVLACAGEGSELITAELDVLQIADARLHLPTVRDSDPAFMHSQLTAIVTR